MRRLRRAAALAMGLTLGVSGLGLPAVAQSDRADYRAVAVESLKAPRRDEAAPRDQAGRALVYVDGQQESTVREAVVRAGGEVSAAQSGRVQAAVPVDKIGELAKQPAVQDIRRPERAVPMAISSEGVAAAGADAWHVKGYRGAGVKVGVIDVGFDGLAQAQSAGELPATGAQLAVNNSNCRDASKHENHGTAIAEVVHDMAPDSALYLACIDGPMDFAAATEWLRQQGVRVITAAVGFLTSGRGDGAGEPGSPAEVVKRTREAGVLWSIAAGNLATGHFSGAAAANAEGWVEFAGSGAGNGFSLARGRPVTVGLRWDAWPKTKEDLDVYVMRRAHPPVGPNDPDIAASSLNNQRDQLGGARPTEEVTFTNDEATDTQVYVYIKNHTTQATTRLDLFVSGTSTPLQYWSKPGSITEPATSPYAMAVGAMEPYKGQTESYSSRGPTVDGRMKPDITGFSKVSTATLGNRAFAGTSVAAAHVAGAAAIFASANPTLDASQLQAALEERTNPKKSDSEWGKGVLALGLPTEIPSVTGAGFTALRDPKRILAERSFGVGELFTLPVPDVPGDATAVVVNVAAWADGPAPAPGNQVEVFAEVPTANSKPTTLQVRHGGGWTSSTMVVTLGKDRAVRLRNGSGTGRILMDLQGYFSQASGSSYFAKPTAARILDTRGFGGSPRTGALKPNEVMSLKVRGVGGVPDNATAVAVNLTGVEATAETWVSAFTTNWGVTSSLNLRRDDRRSNLAIVGIGEDGSIKLRNGPSSVNLIVDVTGWFASDQGARYVALPEPGKIVDTSTGTGGRNTPIGHGEKAEFLVGGVAGVSDTATGVVLAATAREDSLGSELSIRPTDTGWSPVNTISMRQREPITGTTFTPLGGSHKIDVRNERGQAHVSLDAAGYFIGGPPLPSGAGNCVTPGAEVGFGSAFDGRTESNMDGWLTAGQQPVRQDGCELITAPGKDVTWYAARNYGNDYTVKLDWQATTDNADSGIFVLFPNPGANPAVAADRGLEVQIGPRNATGSQRTGSIVPGSAATADAAKPTGQWNTYEITVAWNTVTVLLNGHKVNQYTNPDPARVNVNSFIGLQNNGANDPVRFRDIRIKRNTPVSSGAFIGVNSSCLDLANADVNAGRVWLWECNGSPAQVWTTAGDGTITNTVTCLEVKDWLHGGTAVRLGSCHGAGNQQWIQRPDGSLVNTGTQKCLTPDSPNHESALQVQPCAGRGDQVWRTTEQRGRIGALTTPVGRCLDLANADVYAGALQVWDCNGFTNQNWVSGDKGSLRVASKCMDISGTRVGLYACHGGANQQWIQRPDGTVLNPATGRCLTSGNENSGATIEVQDCAGKPTQIWRMSVQNLWSGPLVGVGGKCADIGSSNNGTPMVLFDCYGAPGQTWMAPGNGRIQSANGACMDAESSSGGVNETKIQAWACPGEGGNQRWVTRHNGVIVTPWADKPLDVKWGDTANFTPIWLWDLNNGLAQRWAIPVRAS